ncbi:FecR family protein [Polaribacter cellanae]|uniref:FecR family protein n=1 Tax=Polaribacter cellanae TaxID=2818493 RepID=A0A975CSB0_9FLAO|nr:FecR family protein [Polaribacter cellanae]QTE22361.1 FecR family protein [Polaribacter cellanae]
MQDKEIFKYLKGTASEIEQEQLEEWIIASPENTAHFNQLKAFYVASTFDNMPNNGNVEKAYANLKENINTTIKLQHKKQKKYWKYAVAASIALLISVTYYFTINNNSNDKRNTIFNQQSNIKIGTDKATLTLEDGSSVALEKGKDYNVGNAQSNGEKLIYNTSKEEKTPKIVYNTLTIPRGGQFFVELSDNTKVWLNSESQLKYPIAFIKGETREVELVYGEAYFEVSPSTKHNGAKFKVLTQRQEVEVLGTEFNIKAYRDETSIYTTLVEGKVALVANNQKEFLKPSQQSTFNIKDKSISLEMVDTYNEIAWKDGVFSFERKPLKEIMKVLSRWYDINVRFESTSIKNTAFNGVLRKKQRLEDILNTIKNTNSINYEIKDKTIIFK